MLAETTNEHLAAAGHHERIDHRSLKDQGIDRVPEPKVGVAAIQMARRGVKSDRLEAWREVREANQRLAQVKVIDRQIDDLSARLATAKLEGERERLAQPVASIDGGTDIAAAKISARLQGNLPRASAGLCAINSADSIGTESQAQKHTKIQEIDMKKSSSERPATQLLKLPRLVGKGILCDWINQLSVREDQASRMLAIALFNDLYSSVIEKAGYRDRLQAWLPDQMAELERYEAAQARYDKLRMMDPGTIIQLPSDEQQYLERLRQLPPDASLDDIRRLDEDTAKMNTRASTPRERGKLLDRYSPAALTDTTGYGASMATKAMESAQQSGKSKFDELNELIKMTM
jgi:hypothetical protein